MTTTNRQVWTSKNASTATGRDGTSTSATTTIPGLLSATNRSLVGSGSGSYVGVKRYAQHAGITPAAVYKRIHAGQLGEGVQRHGVRYMIHPQLADAAWATHGRPCNSRAAQLEARLMANADRIADELAGMPADYCRVAAYRWMDQLLSTEPVE